MTDHPPHAWLATPRTQYFHDPEGHIEAAFVRLRTGKTKRVLRPSPDYQVFLFMGFDGLPIGVKLLEPVPVRLEVTILYRLVAGADGSALGVDRSVETSAVIGAPDAFLEPTRTELRLASAQFERAPA
jgi:hypothetical protein